METLVATCWRQGCGQRARSVHEAALMSLRDLSAAEPRTASAGNVLISQLSDRDAAPDSEHEATVAYTGWLGRWDGAAGRKLSSPALAKQYAEVGTAAFRDLYGQYAVVAATPGALSATADHGGFFPLYHAEEPGIVWVSTSALCLARALGRRLNQRAAMALYLTARVRSPDSAFEGIRRLRCGELLSVDHGVPTVARNWSPIREPESYKDPRECAERGTAILSEVCSSAVKDATPVFDLTGGLDSRLVASCSPLNQMHVTVSGAPDDLDVRLAKDISAKLGWHCHHLMTPDWSAPQRWEYFRRAVLLNDGELAGHEGDAQLLGKEELAQTFDLSITGGLGEILRDFFWQQEFTGLGRPELDVNRVFRYRFSANYTTAPSDLFHDGWIDDYIAHEVAVATRIANQNEGTPNTAKLDALYIWKASGHMGRYLGSSNTAIAGLRPLATRPLLEFALAVPFHYRLRGNLTRRMIAARSPQLAALRTAYGGSAKPISIRNPGLYARHQMFYLGRYLRKVRTVAIRRGLLRPSPNTETDSQLRLSCYLRDQGFFDASRLSSAWLYREQGLERLLKAAQQGVVPAATLGAFASVEILCRGHLAPE